LVKAPGSLKVHPQAGGHFQGIVQLPGPTIILRRTSLDTVEQVRSVQALGETTMQAQFYPQHIHQASRGARVGDGAQESCRHGVEGACRQTDLEHTAAGNLSRRSLRRQHNPQEKIYR